MTMHIIDTTPRPGDIVKVDGREGVAWYVSHEETVSDEDSEWSGYYPTTGNLVCHMVGDDRNEAFDPDELTKLDDDEFCSGCGQTGCSWG